MWFQWTSWCCWLHPQKLTSTLAKTLGAFWDDDAQEQTDPKGEQRACSPANLPFYGVDNQGIALTHNWGSLLISPTPPTGANICSQARGGSEEKRYPGELSLTKFRKTKWLFTILLGIQFTLPLGRWIRLKKCQFILKVRWASRLGSFPEEKHLMNKVSSLTLKTWGWKFWAEVQGRYGNE